MTTGRKLRLASVAAFLAALFVFVSVTHAGAHLGSAVSDPPCATCASPVVLHAGDAAPVRVPALSFEPSRTGSPLRATAAVRSNAPRGPPSHG